MSKNWLIRTTHKQILGPITREKVVELLEKGSLTQEDELCSGSGYWFYIKEKNLVQKYILDSHAQPFNPISEAKDILTADESEEELEVEESSQTENTTVLNLNNTQIDGGASEPSGGDSGMIPEEGDLEYPSMDPEPASEAKSEPAGDVKKKLS